MHGHKGMCGASHEKLGLGEEENKGYAKAEQSIWEEAQISSQGVGPPGRGE